MLNKTNVNTAFKLCKLNEASDSWWVTSQREHERLSNLHLLSCECIAINYVIKKEFDLKGILAVKGMQYSDVHFGNFQLNYDPECAT